MATSSLPPSPQLELMAGELRCPICLSLYKQAASLTCNHCFCTSCIVQSMKRISSCPVCKVPSTPREVRPAPQMDNLVAIFRRMECTAGISVFQSQLSQPDSPGAENAIEMQTSTSCEKRKMRQDSDFRRAPKAPRREKSNDPETDQPYPENTNLPLTPINQRPAPTQAHDEVPAQALVHEDPQGNSTDEHAGTSIEGNGHAAEAANKNLMKDGADAERVENLRGKGAQLPPFFWLRDRELPSQDEVPTQSQTQAFTACALRPSFSDLKGSDDERSEDGGGVDGVAYNVCSDADSYNSDTFEWTQRPCSPELLSSPLQQPNKQRHDGNEAGLMRSQEAQGDGDIPPILTECPTTVKATQTPQPLLESASSSKSKRKEVQPIENRAGSRIRLRSRGSDAAAPLPIPYRKFALRAGILKSPKKVSRNRIASVVKDSSPKSRSSPNPGASDASRPRRKIQLEADLASNRKDDSRTGTGNPAVKLAGSNQACMFCGSAETSEVAGPLISYKEAFPSQGVKEFHVHKLCAEWAPDVYFEDDKPMNLASEIRRGSRIKCSSCGKRGAALGCCNKRCKKSFHYPCGRATPGCKWDENDFVMFCPQHGDCSFPKRKRCTANPTHEALLARDKEAKPSREEVPSEPNLAKQRQRWPPALASKWVLCGSGLESDAKAQLASFASLTGATITKRWTSSVTHVITAVDENGAAKRTLKFLMSTLLGKWTVTTKWMEACQKLGHPVAESKFEVMKDVNGVIGGPQRSRENAAAKGPNLLEGLSFYFSGEFKSTGKKDLQALITSGGGVVLQRKPLRVAQNLDNMPSTSRSTGTSVPSSGRAIVIYDGAETADGVPAETRNAFSIARQGCADAVSHFWLLDSVASFSLQPIPELHPI